MTTMTDNEWRSFVTAGTRLAHIALTRADGSVHPLNLAERPPLASLR